MPYHKNCKVTKLITFILIYVVSINLVCLGIANKNPIGLCQFPNVPTHSVEEGKSVCDNMAPRDGIHAPEKSKCPWKIFIFNRTIRPHHTQPVILGSVEGKSIFNEFIITAKPLGEYKNNFLGHFEPQYDCEPVCCDTEYAFPNMLVSSKVRRLTPNETLLWTAPLDYRGSFQFLVTFIISSRKYWFEIKSDTIEVVDDDRSHASRLSVPKNRKNFHFHG